MTEGVPAVADPSTTMALSSCYEVEGAGMARLSLPLHHQVRGDMEMAPAGTLRVCESRDAICEGFADTDFREELCSACVDLSGCKRGDGVDRCNVSRVEDTAQQ